MSTLRTSLIALLVLALPLTLGCPGEDDDDATGDDDVTGDDDDDTTADDDDDVTGDDDDDTFVPDQIDGFVTFYYSERNDGGSGVAQDGRIDARFFEVVAAEIPGVVFEEPANADECAVTVYTYSDIAAATPAELTPQSAGTLTVDGAGGGFSVEPVAIGDTIYYSEVQIPVASIGFGTDYSVSAAGDMFGAFSATDALEFPPQMSITSPSPGTQASFAGDIAVSWTGGAPNRDVMLTITANRVQDYVTIICRANNDGSFTIPSSATAELLSGSIGTLTMTNVETNYVDMDGRWVEFTAGAMIVVNGYK